MVETIAANKVMADSTREPAYAFAATKLSPTIAEGALVIIYISRDNLIPIIIQADQSTQTRYGKYNHSDMLGMQYGSKMSASSGRGYCYLLRPTPELWTMALSHRTQILYLPDIAFITSYLNIKPGDNIIEAGTGSGSFTHSVARTIGSKGNLFSFEFHEQRCSQAREEFRSHGLAGIVHLEHRNVCKDGFGDAKDIDAVFLDLPAPWEAIPHARQIVRGDRLTRICCFSPCMEQVVRTVSALNEHGYTNVTMYETLVRQHDCLSYSAPTISDAIARLQEIENRKIDRRHAQQEDAKLKKLAIANSKQAEMLAENEHVALTAADCQPAEATRPEAIMTSLKRELRADIPEDVQTVDATIAADEPPAKRVKIRQVQSPPTVTNTEAIAADTDTPCTPVTGIIAPAEAPAPTANGMQKVSYKTAKLESERLTTTKPASQIRGHTSYLTFAVLLPQESADL